MHPRHIRAIGHNDLGSNNDDDEEPQSPPTTVPSIDTTQVAGDSTTDKSALTYESENTTTSTTSTRLTFDQFTQFSEILISRISSD